MATAGVVVFGLPFLLAALSAFPDARGTVETRRLDGRPLDLQGAFFQPLGPGGRTCASCHRPAQGWTISAFELKERFEATGGKDPIFRTIDGSNCDRGVDTSTVESRRAAYSLLLDRGLIRIALPVPSNAEFEVVSVKNPWGCNDPKVLSVYRRPLPATNLRLVTSVMWDGRESMDLAHQALTAATVHALAAAPLTPQQQAAIVAFETNLVTAQASDREAGDLDADGAKGGPRTLAAETIPAFFAGVNDPHAGDPHAIKAENAIRLFDAWSKLPYGRLYTEVPIDHDARAARRAAIARGQLIFNQKPFDIRGVAGLNDAQSVPSITGACGTCHNSPNAGNHSVPDSMNTGVTDRLANYLPAIVLRNRKTLEMRTTTDPGRALVTGLWSDVGKLKTPVLRGLASRPPWFHNGSVDSLGDVVDFYDQRFHIGFSAREKADLVAFLESL